MGSEHLFFRALVGSHAYGLATEKSDRDYMEGFVVDPREFLGLGAASAVNSTQSVSAVEDVARHELGKFVSLLLKGNPSITETLFLESYECSSPLMEALRANASQAISQRTLAAYLGYVRSQVGKAEFKVKALGHAIRLCCDGIAIAETGRPFVLVQPEVQTLIQQLREQPHQERSQALAYYLRRLDGCVRGSTLPPEPNRGLFEEIVLDYRLDMVSWVL